MKKERRTIWGLIGFTLVALSLFFAAQLQSSAEQQQGEQLAEQRYKNIQVLKGVPESQVIPIMQFMSASLGTNCARCHVNNNGNWEFEKDDKPAKQTARRMIQMTLDINKGSRDALRGTSVTCFTCHRGASDPVNIPSLPIAVNAEGAGAGRKFETPPTPAQVLDKYVQAIGGREAASRLKTRVMKGTITGADGKPMPFEVRLQGDKVLTVINGPQGTITQALNGSTGWMQTPKETRELRPNEVSRFRSVAQSFEALQVTDAAANMKVLRPEKVGDKTATVILWPVDERHTQKLYFDAQTGLLLRVITYLNTALGPIPSQVDFEDYRAVEGVQLPFTIRQSSVDARNDSTRKFDEVRANVPTSDAQFNPPAKK